MFVILSANNFDTNISIIGVRETKEDAFYIMVEAFIKDLNDRDIIPGEDGVPAIPKNAAAWSASGYEWSASFTDTGFSITGDGDLTYGVIQELPTIPATTQPVFNGVLAVTLIRQRIYEGEAWSNEYRIPLTTEETALFSKYEDSYAAKQLILKRIHEYMASKVGWEAICRASQDFNWGDAVQDDIIDSACQTIDGGFTTENHIQVNLTVNQDELIAPDKVSASFKAFDDSNTLIYNASYVILNMQNGTIDMNSDIPNKIMKRIQFAYIILPNGDQLECDKDEDFLRLKGV